ARGARAAVAAPLAPCGFRDLDIPDGQRWRRVRQPRGSAERATWSVLIGSGPLVALEGAGVVATVLAWLPKAPRSMPDASSPANGAAWWHAAAKRGRSRWPAYSGIADWRLPPAAMRCRRLSAANMICWAQIAQSHSAENVMEMEESEVGTWVR